MISKLPCRCCAFPLTFNKDVPHAIRISCPKCRVRKFIPYKLAWERICAALSDMPEDGEVDHV